jgi:hypothetical protein
VSPQWVFLAVADDKALARIPTSGSDRVIIP